MKNATINMERYTIRCAVYLFLIQDNKLLLLRRKNTGWKDGEYGVPAGHLEKGETIKEAAVREVKEETTIEIDQKELKLVHVMHRRANFEYIDFYFSLNSWRGEPTIGEKDFADHVEWFPTNSFPVNTIDYVRVAFENWKKEILFSEFGWQKHP